MLVRFASYISFTITRQQQKREKDKNRLKIANSTPSLKYRKRNINEKKIRPRVFDRWH